MVDDHRRLSLAVMTVFGGFLVQCTLSGSYIRSHMIPYVISYMKNYTSPFNASDKEVSLWIFDLTAFGFTSSMALGGFIDAKTGPFLTLVISSWIMSGSIVACYWTIQVNVITLAVTHGFLSAVGAGMAYSVSMAPSIEWFQKSTGLICGILVSGFSLGPFNFDILQAYVIENQDINKPYRVPLSFIYIGSIYLLIQFVGAALIRKRRSTVSETSDEDIIPLFQSKDEQIQLEPHQLMRSRNFWILWMSYSLNSSVVIIVHKLSHPFGQHLRFSSSKLTLIAEISEISSAMGKLLWGFLNDKVAYKVLMPTLTLLSGLMIGTFYCCSLVGDLNKSDEISRYTIFVIWEVTLHFLISGNFSIFPSMCVKTFGAKYFAKNYGVLFTACSFASVVTSLATFSVLNNTDDSKTFLITFLSACGLSILSSLVTLFYVEKV